MLLKIVLLLVVFWILFTRFNTGRQAARDVQPTPGTPRNVPTVPYWIPVVGHLVPFVRGAQHYLRELNQSYFSVFSIVIMGSKHNIITAPSVRANILAPRQPVTNGPFVTYVTKNYFGDEGELGRALEKDPEVMSVTNLHKPIADMMREPFLRNAVKATVRTLEENIPSFLSGTSDPDEQQTWEQSANAHLLPTTKGLMGTTKLQLPAAEVSLYMVIRDFMTDISTRVLMGDKFLDTNPRFVKDLWTLDASFHTLLLGTPTGLFAELFPACRARKRLLKAVQDHHESIYSVEKSDNEIETETPDSSFSNVSNVMWDLARRFKNMNAHPSLASSSAFSVIWATNVNTAQIAFWNIFHVITEPGLLEEVLEEAKPYIRKVEATEDELKESPRLPYKLEIDGQGIKDNCPLLMGTFYETLRLDAAGQEYRIATDDFVVRESQEDAEKAGRNEPESFRFKKGEFLCIPNWVHAMDSRYFEEPEKFKPRRFFKPDFKLDGNVKTDQIDIGTFKPWGGGNSMCKGRILAVQEVMFFVAAFLTCFEVKGDISHPGRVFGAGAFTPKKDLRVRLNHRAI